MPVCEWKSECVYMFIADLRKDFKRLHFSTRNFIFYFTLNLIELNQFEISFDFDCFAINSTSFAKMYTAEHSTSPLKVHSHTLTFHRINY